MKMDVMVPVPLATPLPFTVVVRLGCHTSVCMVAFRLNITDLVIFAFYEGRQVPLRCP